MQEIKLLIYSCHNSHLGLSKTFSEAKNFRIEKRTSIEGDIISDIQKAHPDIILICCHFLIGKCMDFITEVMQKINGAKIVVFNFRFGEKEEIKFAQSGVKGILAFDCPPKKFYKALQAVQNGDLWLKRKIITQLINGPNKSDQNIKNNQKNQSFLTKRELEIFSMVAAGLKNQEISSELYIAEGTVKTHINKIYKKLDVDNRVQATLYAIENNFAPWKNLPKQENKL